MTWFANNYMKMNSDRCNLILGKKSEHMWAQKGEHKIWKTKTAKLLGITIDKNLKFDEHLSNICPKK